MKQKLVLRVSLCIARPTIPLPIVRRASRYVLLFALCRSEAGCRLFAREDAIAVSGGAYVVVDSIKLLRAEAPIRCVIPERVDVRQTVPHRPQTDQIAMRHRTRARRQDQAAARLVCEHNHCALRHCFIFAKRRRPPNAALQYGMSLALLRFETISFMTRKKDTWYVSF